MPRSQTIPGEPSAALSRLHLIGDEDDAVVVGHETLRGVPEGILDAGVDALRLHAEERADVRLQEPRAELFIDEP
jgi:hypothetical protein